MEHVRIGLGHWLALEEHTVWHGARHRLLEGHLGCHGVCGHHLLLVHVRGHLLLVKHVCHLLLVAVHSSVDHGEWARTLWSSGSWRTLHVVLLGSLLLSPLPGITAWFLL